METNYTLPYDYTRCDGKHVENTLHPSCANCLRKLAPGHEYRQSFFMKPPMDENGSCKYFIKAEG